jgi:transcriptional regulator with GAF, ATPase, and Fis domain
VSTTTGSEVLHASLPWEGETLLSERRCRLVVHEGPVPGSAIELGDGELRVGSAPPAELVLAHPSIAPLHFSIRREGDGWLLLDLGSERGTFLNGMQVRRAWLRPGGLIQAGDLTLRFAAEKAPLHVPPSPAHRFGPLVGDSVQMREIFALLDRIAPSEATVLLVGETGTGKGAVARAIHGRGSRAARSLLTVDCSAISESLIESELFGHERGAFTGADRQRLGMLEASSGGTLFLDEIDDLPLPLQPKLLRALEERLFQRVGSSTPLRFDARVIAASKRDLWQMVQQGRFREDLFFRLSVFTVRLPPLRERPGDVAALADELMGAPTWALLPPDVRERFLTYPWPGNVRELRNALERARHLSGLPGPLRAESVLMAPAEPAAPRLPTPPAGMGHVPAEVLPVDYAGGFKEAKERLVSAFERDYLARLLQRTGGNVAAAARLADVDRKHLASLLRKHGLIASH